MGKIALDSVKLEKVTLYLAVETYGLELAPDGLTSVLQALQDSSDESLRIIDYTSEKLELIEKE